MYGLFHVERLIFFFFLHLYGNFGDDYCDTGIVKLTRSTLRIVHDCSHGKNDVVSELQSALSHMKEYRATNDLASRNLDPKSVHSLFTKMSDEVGMNTNVDVFGCFYFSFSFEEGLLCFKTLRMPNRGLPFPPVKQIFFSLL